MLNSCDRLEVADEHLRRGERMNEVDTREAWVKIPMPDEPDATSEAGNPYDFGFVPAMSRLIATHPDIEPLFGALFQQIMFAPGGALSRAEREMTAAVSAAAQDCFY